MEEKGKYYQKLKNKKIEAKSQTDNTKFSQVDYKTIPPEERWNLLAEEMINNLRNPESHGKTI
jgi:hypothetical protein